MKNQLDSISKSQGKICTPNIIVNSKRTKHKFNQVAEGRIRSEK
jgi:hypothetical protein